VSVKPTGIVRLLLSHPKYDISCDYNEKLLFEACEDSYIKLVKLLLSDLRLNFLNDNSKFLIEASRKGQMRAVEGIIVNISNLLIRQKFTKNYYINAMKIALCK
jgi:hypothetical protein